MYDLRDLREMLCKELDEIAAKREMSAGDLDAIQKLTSSIKNTYKIEMFEDGDYSRDDGYSRGGTGRQTCAVHMVGAALTGDATATQWADTAEPMPESICANNWTT